MVRLCSKWSRRERQASKTFLQKERANTQEIFRYSVLEIADVLTSREEILERESHWKDILMTRSYGLNAN